MSAAAIASMPRPAFSPWSQIDDAQESAPGIWFVSTLSHGGFIVSDERRAAMPEAMRQLSTFAGGNAYEEDNDAAIVILAFPLEFTARQIREALRQVHWTASYLSLSAEERAAWLAIRDAYLALAEAY